MTNEQDMVLAELQSAASEMVARHVAQRDAADAEREFDTKVERAKKVLADMKRRTRVLEEAISRSERLHLQLRASTSGDGMALLPEVTFNLEAG